MIDAFIQKGIIQPEQLAPLLDRGDIKLIDASYVLPGALEKPYEVFWTQRIGNAVYFDIEKISDHTSPLPHMLPSKGEFETALSELGIRNNDTLIIYGQKDSILGPARVWWMMRIFGHDNVAVLDGGLPAWQAAGYPVVQSHSALPALTHYKVKTFRSDLVSDLAQVAEAACPVLDARSKPRFDGLQEEPRAGLRSGHIPGSLNVPAGSVVSETGKLKSPEELEALFKNVGYANTTTPPILTCGSGVTACMLALALFSIGQKEASVYDGSWSEWGQEGRDTKIAKTV